MRYEHTVTVRRETTEPDGAGGVTATTVGTVYAGKADVQDVTDLIALRDAGTEGRTMIEVFFPGTVPVRLDDLLVWDDTGAEGRVVTVSRLDGRCVVSLNE